jgi:signal transduction histidine kinase
MANLLIVDDEITTQLVLQDLLESEGHTVWVADNGQQGWDLAQKHLPNLIVCDWVMPGLDGLELCRRVKAHSLLETTFFILLTARENLDDRVCGLDAGADDFIAKPLEAEELLARVRAGLRLHQLNQQLQQSLQDLQATQAQLVHSEKMSSLGRLVGGIAHEINNPISFIYGNLSHVKSYTQTLSGWVRSLRDDASFSREQLLAQLEELDFEFIVEDLDKILNSMKDGSERIRDIVVSLQEFASQDRAGLQEIDIHHSLDLALSMLQPYYLRDDLEQSVKIERNYGEIPTIFGYISPLNQAFFNLLENAIEAVLEKMAIANDPNWSPQVTVKTRPLDSHWLEIEISDTGIGMTSDLQGKMFDPFFTTKPVGRGKGLGLSVSYQIIVKQHGGKLTYRSASQAGSHFYIRLPLKGDLAKA